MSDTGQETPKLPSGCLGFLRFLLPAGSRHHEEITEDRSGEKAPKVALESMPYEAVGALLTAAERSFYGVLCSCAGNAVIATKVRLADLCKIPSGAVGRRGWLNRVSSKHVDFVLCDPKTITPRVAIELDDSSHSRADRRSRDEFVDAFFACIELPLVRIPASPAYSASELRNVLADALKSSK